jgi:hypothetical protein
VRVPPDTEGNTFGVIELEEADATEVPLALTAAIVNVYA